LTNTEHPYAKLQPHTILDAIDQQGFSTSGSLFALNSYENRVFQIGLEDNSFIIAKFYRPERLSDSAILEEHDFLQQCQQAELPFVAPLTDDKQASLFTYQDFRFALFPRVSGHFPELDNPDILYRLGQLLGRTHAQTSLKDFQYREKLSIDNMLRIPSQFLLDNDFIPREHITQYQRLIEQFEQDFEEKFLRVKATSIRLHGDFHAGNILQQNNLFNIVDTDDCRMGPAIQDIWLLLSHNNHEIIGQLNEVIEGYEEFFDFNHHEFTLIEPLRTLRMIHYAYWLAKRWQDPAFPMHFPWFNQGSYWDEHINSLREQLIRLDMVINLHPAMA